MSIAFLERLGITTPDQPIRQFNPEIIANSLPGWENRELKEPIGHPLAGWQKGWQLYIRLDPSDQSDYSDNSAHHLTIYNKTTHPLVFINFAGQPDAGWVVREARTFNVARNGDITFVGSNGKYEISHSGHLHTFKPSDGSKKKVVMALILGDIR